MDNMAEAGVFQCCAAWLQLGIAGGLMDCHQCTQVHHAERRPFRHVSAAMTANQFCHGQPELKSIELSTTQQSSVIVKAAEKCPKGLCLAQST